MNAPLLLLHGFAGSPLQFEPLLATLGLPAERVLAPFIAGHGDAPPPDSFEQELERLVALIGERRGLTLCGYSLGARLGLGLLQHRPELFRAAVLIGVNPGLETEAEREARRHDDERWAELLERDGSAAFSEAWERQPLFASQAGLPPALRAGQRALRASHDPRGLAQALRALGLAAMPDYWPALGGIALPVEILVGAGDAKFVAIGERIAARLRHGRLQVVSGAGHNVVLERPDVVCDVLRRIHGG